GGAVTIDASTISNNTSEETGGGVFTDAGQLDVQNGSLIDNNVANATSGTSDGGGGIYHEGSDASHHTKISYSTISNNKTFNNGYGAGIHSQNGGELTIEYSTINGNINAGNGGGIVSYNPTLNISHSAIYNNQAERNAGIGIYDADATISNTTISGNTASVDGGGVAIEGRSGDISNFYNVTISNNSGGATGGIDFGAYTSTINIYNSIIANNTGSTANDCYGTNATWNFNSIPSILEDPSGCTPSNAGSVLNVDPSLAGLADNGGPTMTHAITSTSSPAYNASGGSATSDDQRGVAAVGTRDIGAFEYTGDDAALVVVSSDPADGSTKQTVTKLDITYNKDVVSGGVANAGDNTANY
ncbi:MAG: hypothetical protein GY727_08660, partial [Gammaproteobacteria bacterium]|nr:hypothetical protein [Gammaproteobacteria bacterium]